MARSCTRASATSATYSISRTVSQMYHVKGASMGTRGGISVVHNFPADGEYVFAIDVEFGKGTRLEDVDISVADDPVALLALAPNGSRVPVFRTDHPLTPHAFGTEIPTGRSAPVRSLSSPGPAA